MKTKKSLILTIFLLISLTTFAQTYTVKGVVTDSIGEPLIGATVVLLTAKDSMLTYFASTDNNGKFNLNHISKGKYIFQASYTSYKKQEEPIDLFGNNKLIDKGTISLEKIAFDLKTVEIEGERVPVQFLNDTLIYDALSFDPGKNTTVEDLLKKMPGIEVDEKGNIKAQGKQVKKVTVDGKEFFGNDPKMATQNLPAEAVKKVKVFDKKSDFSETTGIDDGKEEKTIDLELKEDHKNGVFGKITAGYGTENTYLGNATINKFTSKFRISLITKTNNTSKEGFSLMDFAEMNGGFEEMFQSSNGEIELGGYTRNNGGIYKVIDAGLNINYNPKKNIDLSISYFLNKKNSLIITNDLKENYLSGFEYKSLNNSEITKNLFNHNVNTLLKYEINKNNKIKWNFKFNNRAMDNEGNDTLSIYNNSDNLSNYQEGNTSGDKNGINASSYLTYSKKFKKYGRAIFSKLNGKYSKNTEFKQIISLNEYYTDSPELDFIYQKHDNLTDNSSYSGSIGYTEPLWKMTYLIVDANQAFTKNQFDRNLFDKYPQIGDIKNKKDKYISEFNHSDVKFSFKYNGIKQQFDIGLKYQYSTQNGDYISSNKKIKKTYKNLLPNLNYSIKFTTHSTFKFNFHSEIKAPSILQLMPIVDNSNPQFVLHGNSQLEPETSNKIRLSYNNYNSFDNRSLWVSLYGTITQNSIINSRSIDELYRTISKPVNLGQSEKMSLYTNYSMPFKLIKSGIGLSLSTNYNHSNTLLNNIQDDYQMIDYQIKTDIHNFKNKYITGKIGVSYKKTFSIYSINENTNNSYNKIKYFANTKLKITKNLTFKNSIKYNLYSNKLSDQKDAEILWDAHLKLFLKDKRYAIKLAAVDLLNQGIGYKQFSADNYIQYTKTNRIGRYFMLSLTYSLSKFKAPKTGMIIFTED